MSDQFKNGLGLTTEETIALATGLQTGPRNPTSAAIKTGITNGTTALGGYPLEKPAKSLYFIEDAMRRRIPRVVNPMGGDTAHWKVITAINSAKVKAGVAEGALATAITLATSPKSAAYKTLNQTNSYTDEAKFFVRQFMDMPQLGMLSTLQSLMIQEDRYIIGGNQAVLGAPTGLTVTDSATAGSLSAGTDYSYAVSALTVHGWLNGAKGKVTGVDSPDETDPVAVVNHGNLGGAITSVDLAWNDVKGAFAYNVFITLTGGAYKWQKTVFANGCNLGTIAAGNPCNAADQTADTLGYSGILEQLVAVSSGAYYKSMDNAVLTSDGAGGVVQIEAMLASIWNNYRVSPTMMLINSQEATSIKKLTVGSSTANAVRVTISQDDKNKFTAGSAVNTYFSPYTEQLIEFKTSVHCPPGKIIGIGETVPYPNAEVPNNLEVELQQEYYGEIFARTSRVTPVGVTAIGALKVYLPGACGIISNIKAG